MTNLSDRAVTVSIVSHGQGELVAALLGDIARCSNISEVILTQNIPEGEIACPEALRSRLHLIRNDWPKGFAANHNAAFGLCKTPVFAILNPDMSLPEDPFPQLLACLADTGAALVAPAVVNARHEVEDNARKFPTPLGLLSKAMGLSDGRLAYQIGTRPLQPDWLAGMFLMVDSEIFRAIGGFDEGFHLYYEDVDLCARMRKAGKTLFLCPEAQVIHDARRSSRHELRYLRWHISSLVRYLVKHWGRLPKVQDVASWPS